MFFLESFHKYIEQGSCKCNRKENFRLGVRKKINHGKERNETEKNFSSPDLLKKVF